MGTPGSTLLASDLDTLKAKLSYAWGVWEFHGRQWMSMFNYFLVIVGILVTGYTTARKENALHDLVPAICLLGLVQCFVFLMIDWRNRTVLYFADSVLKESEEKLFKSVPDGLAGPMSQRAAKESKGLFRFSKMVYWMWMTYILIGIGFLVALVRSIRGH